RRSPWATATTTTRRPTGPGSGSPCRSTTTASSTGESATSRATQRSTASPSWGRGPGDRPDAGLLQRARERAGEGALMTDAGAPRTVLSGKASDAKAGDGDAPVFAYIASLPQPQRAIAEHVD